MRDEWRSSLVDRHELDRAARFQRRGWRVRVAEVFVVCRIPSADAIRFAQHPVHFGDAFFAIISIKPCRCDSKSMPP